MDAGYRPLVYMWVAEFTDGSALPQYDPETGAVNKGNPDWLPEEGTGPKAPTPDIFKEKTLCKFGWYPFSEEIVDRVPVLAVPSSSPIHTVELNDGDKLVAARRSHIEIGVMGGGYRRVASLYLLGIKGGEVKHIGEDGRVVEAS